MQDEVYFEEEAQTRPKSVWFPGKLQRRGSITPGTTLSVNQLSPCPSSSSSPSSQSTSPLSLAIQDLSSNVVFLVDSGADISVFPATAPDRRPSRASFPSLVAANGSSIRTFGKKSVDLHFNDLKTSHVFHLAAVSRPILGADFFSRHGLLIDLRGRRLLRLHPDGSSICAPLPAVDASAAATSLSEVCGLHLPRSNSVDSLLDLSLIHI